MAEHGVEVCEIDGVLPRAQAVIDPGERDGEIHPDRDALIGSERLRKHRFEDVPVRARHAETLRARHVRHIDPAVAFAVVIRRRCIQRRNGRIRRPLAVSVWPELEFERFPCGVARVDDLRRHGRLQAPFLRKILRRNDVRAALFRGRARRKAARRREQRGAQSETYDPAHKKDLPPRRPRRFYYSYAPCPRRMPHRRKERRGIRRRPLFRAAFLPYFGRNLSFPHDILKEKK